MKCLLTISFLFSYLNLPAQDKLSSLYYPNINLNDVPYHIASQIHSLDDFMKRFNGENNGIGQPFDKESELYQSVKNDVST